MTGYGSFSFPDSFKPIWEKFKKLAKREGKNASELIRILVAHYVDVHDPGNPQARITSYTEGGPVDTSIIEGRVREHFRTRGPNIPYRDIVALCKQNVPDLRAAVAMAQRVAAWLQGRRIKVWR